MTHAHPDHIGTAHYFREKYGTKIYASEGERAWIEDIDLQFAWRPIPNFYRLAGKSTPVDHVVKDGDIPIFIHLDDTRNSLTILKELPGIETFYPAWDQVYSLEMMHKKIADARELINELEKIVCDVNQDVELSELVHQVCDSLQMPMWKTNPLFAKTVECCRREKK